jgi:hypothetical protein
MAFKVGSLPISAARGRRREGQVCVTKRACSVACNPEWTADSRCRSTVDKVEPAIYAANIEKSGDCWVTVCLDRQHDAFHGFRATNPEWAGSNSAARARPSPQPWHDGLDDNDQPGKRRAETRKSCRWPRSCAVSWPKPKRPCRGPRTFAETRRAWARVGTGTTGRTMVMQLIDDSQN